MWTIRSVVSISSIGMTILGASVVSAQNYPNRPIRIISSEAGTFLDSTARVIAQEISGPLGQPVIVESQSSAVLPDNTAKAKPDGYTVGFVAGATWLTPFIQKTSYDPVKDFSPITTVVTYPYVLVVHPSVPVRSVRELIDLAKARPGVLNYATTPNPGTASFLAGELLKAMTGVNIVRVPYKGAASGLIAVMTGESHLIFIAPITAIPQIKAGKLKPLAVSSLEPTPLVPGMPTVAAAGLPGYEVLTVIGVFAPAGTPGPIINRLNQEMVRILNRADVKEKFLNEGAETLGSSPEQFAAFVKADMAKWGKVLRDIGIKPD